MRVFRIAKRKFIEDLSGEGARLFGGRWNKKGTSLLYTSECRSLATVEYLVHLPMSIMANDVCIAEIEIPDTSSISTVDISMLPDLWMSYPSPKEIAEIGDKWKWENSTLLLKVPSAVVKNEWNYLVNTGHHDFPKVRIVTVEEYVFDTRLLRRRSKANIKFDLT